MGIGSNVPIGGATSPPLARAQESARSRRTSWTTATLSAGRCRSAPTIARHQMPSTGASSLNCTQRTPAGSTLRGEGARMAHRYGQPIMVTRAADGMPASFRWRDAEYVISEVFATWHLRDL